MPKFIVHEPLANDLLNANHGTAHGTLQPWGKYLVNTNSVLSLLVRRLESDWLNLAPKMRKPWNGKEVETLLSFSCMFSLWLNLFVVHFLNVAFEHM